MRVECLSYFEPQSGGNGYWCSSEMSVNIICSRMVKYEIGKNSPMPITYIQYPVPDIQYQISTHLSLIQLGSEFIKA
jgi:hypothetical protein